MPPSGGEEAGGVRAGDWCRPRRPGARCRTFLRLAPSPEQVTIPAPAEWGRACAPQAPTGFWGRRAGAHTSLRPPRCRNVQVGVHVRLSRQVMGQTPRPPRAVLSAGRAPPRGPRWTRVFNQLGPRPCAPWPGNHLTPLGLSFPIRNSRGRDPTSRAVWAEGGGTCRAATGRGHRRHGQGPCHLDL